MILKVFELLYVVTSFTDIKTLYYVLGCKNQFHVLDQAINVVQSQFELDYALTEASVEGICSYLKLEALEIPHPREQMIREKLLSKPGFESFLTRLSNHPRDEIVQKVDLIMQLLHS